MLAAAFTLPAMVALFVLPEFFVEGLYLRGAFTPDDAIAVASALKIYALGLPAFILIKVFAPGFFARQNTKLPMLVAVFSMVLNIAIGAVLFFQIGFVGLAMATSIAGWVNGLILGFLLWRGGFFTPDAKTASKLVRFSAAALVMGVGLVLIAYPLREALAFLPFWYLSAAIVVGAVGLVLYGVAAICFGALKLLDIRAVFRRS